MDISNFGSTARVFNWALDIFLLFVNNLSSATESDVMLFADDTKLWRLIRDDTDILALQNDINRIIQWCDKWSLKLNVKKCKHICL